MLMRYRGFMPWEYMHVKANTAQMTDVDRALNQLGAEGWEVVGFASADKTIGLNMLVCILKRYYEAMAAPADNRPGWKPDPTSHEHRWWTGEQWSSKVRDGKKESTDWPRIVIPQSQPA